MFDILRQYRRDRKLATIGSLFFLLFAQKLLRKIICYATVILVLYVQLLTFNPNNISIWAEELHMFRHLNYIAFLCYTRLQCQGDVSKIS